MTDGLLLIEWLGTGAWHAHNIIMGFDENVDYCVANRLRTWHTWLAQGYSGEDFAVSPLWGLSGNDNAVIQLTVMSMWTCVGRPRLGA